MASSNDYKERYIGVSGVTSGATSLSTTLLPSCLFDQSEQNIETLLSLTGEPPTAISVKDGYILLNASGKPIGCARTLEMVSMFMEERYGHLVGKGKQQLQLMKDCGHQPQASTNTRADEYFRDFMSKGAKLVSLQIKPNRRDYCFDQFMSFTGKKFMKKLIPYMVGDINRMSPKDRRGFLNLCRDASFLHVFDSLQLPDVITSIAQLAPSDNLHRKGPILEEEVQVKNFTLTLYGQGGIPGLAEDTTVYVLLSFLLRRTIASCIWFWPGLTGRYQGFIASPNSSNNLKQLLRLLVQLYARNNLCRNNDGKFTVSEEAKASTSYKASRKMAGETRTTNNANEKADEVLVISDCRQDLAKLLGISVEDMTLTVEGVGGCADEERALIVALGLWNSRDLVPGLENLSFGTFITEFLNTNWKRVFNLLTKSDGKTAGIKEDVYDEHNSSSDLSTVAKQKELGQLIKKVGAYRKSDEYKQQAAMAKKIGENVTAAHDKKRADKKKSLDFESEEDLRVSSKSSNKKKGKSKAGSGGSGSSSAKSSGLKSSSNKVNTSSQTRGEKQPSSRKAAKSWGMDALESASSKSSKKKGKPKAGRAAGSGGSGNRGGSSKSSLDPFESNPFAKSVAEKKSSGKSTGLKASSNKANTSTSRTKGKKQPTGQKVRPSSSNHANRGGKRQVMDNGMSMDNVFDEPRRRSTSNRNARDTEVDGLLDDNEAAQRAAMPGLHAMRVNDDVDDDSGEEHQDMGSSSDDNDDYNDEDYDDENE